MIALSLTQPWAALLAMGAKTVETRDWPTNFRGWFAIHASKGFPREARDFAYTTKVVGALDDARKACIAEPVPWLQHWWQSAPDDLPLGAIIGVAHLSHCEPTTNVFDLDGSVRVEHCTVLNALSNRMMNFRDVPLREQNFGDYRKRGDRGKLRYAFWTTHAIPLLEPITVNGSLGFWRTLDAAKKAGEQYNDHEETDYYEQSVYRELQRRGITLPMHGMHAMLRTRGQTIRQAASLSSGDNQ